MLRKPSASYVPKHTLSTCRIVFVHLVSPCVCRRLLSDVQRSYVRCMLQNSYAAAAHVEHTDNRCVPERRIETTNFGQLCAGNNVGLAALVFVFVELVLCGQMRYADMRNPSKHMMCATIVHLFGFVCVDIWLASSNAFVVVVVVFAK